MIPAASMAQRARRHQALVAVCAVFLLVGVLTLDDYGASIDAWAQIATGNAALDYLAGEGEGALDQAFSSPHRNYGAVFEAPLVLLTERVLGLEDSRDVFLARHLLTHLFFLAGGVFCYLLVLRLFGSRLLALVAMLLFLLHPRIYAHSFFNSKDVPFLVAFMIALWLTHRAFRRETLGAFLLCGVGVGLLVNLRVMGIALFAAVLVLRLLDLAFVGNADGRKRVLLAGGAFALAAVLAYYASLPILWTDPPGRFAELLGVLSAHPIEYANLFRGEWLYSPNGPPLAYVPVWVGITTPPATLLLAAAGAVALAWRGLRRPREALRDGPVRFGLLLVALPVATTVAVVLLENNVYSGWRQLYFLYAPLLLLAVFGLHGLTRARPGRWLRAGAYALAGTALAVAVVSLARIHPHEHNYFSLLVDRTTPEGLSSRYELDYWRQSYGSLAGNVLDDHPAATLFLRGPLLRGPLGVIGDMLPADDRARIVSVTEFRSGDVNLYRLPRFFRACPHGAPGTYAAGVYGSTIECVVDPVAYFGGLREQARATEPLSRSRFDAWRVGNVMVYARDGCTREDMAGSVFLRVYPIDPGDLPDQLREFPDHRAAYGFEKRDFAFRELGTRIDGDCVAVALLPDYPIARIETGQYTPDWAEAARRAVAGSEPRARSRFDVWLDERTLTYVRDGCSAEDADARFRLHVYPVDQSDTLAPRRRAEHGFDNLDFSLREQGARTEGGSCVAVVPLPAYPIAHVHTGQFAPDGGDRWDARFALSLPEVDPAALTGEPLARAVFDVWLDGGALVYVKEGCTEAVAAVAFFLHVYPVDEADLPDAGREHGFENRDFFLWERGMRTDGRCLAVAPLPGWPIARVETGQHDETGRLWTAEFAPPDGR